MVEVFSNSATPKYLGYVYQVLIAIEQCLKAKANEVIWIECFGDVYDGKTSTEVKHHFGKTNLTDNSVDFWKTLKNLMVENTGSFDSLVLHTTATISEKSIFYGWNDLTRSEKYTKLKNHTPSKTIESDYGISITRKKKKDILSVLDKLTIKSSQLNIKDKWEEIKEGHLFTLVDEKHKDDALDWVYGYINKQAISNRHNWNVKINDFKSACSIALSKYTKGNIQFDIICKSEIDVSASSFKFVESLNEIKLKERPIERAISDYLRSEKSKIKLLKHEPFTMSVVLDHYDDSILENMESLKNNSLSTMADDELDTDKSIQISTEIYFSCMKSPLINIPEVDNTQKYYQDGRMHHNVNQERFVWKIRKDDLL